MIRSFLIILILMAAFILLPENSFGQCDVKVEYKVENSEIHLKSDKPMMKITIELYDLIKEKVVARQEDLKILNINDWTIGFENIERSTYLILVKYNDCETVLGGLGVNVDSN